MSDPRRAWILEWGLRLVVLALLALWVVTPPQDHIRMAVPAGEVR